MPKSKTFDYAHCWILRCNIMIYITNQYKLLRNDTIFQRQYMLLNVLSKQLSLKVRLYIPKIYLRYLHETKQQSKKINSFGYNGDTKVDQPVFIDSIFRISLFSLTIWVRYIKNINNLFWIMFTKLEFVWWILNHLIDIGICIDCSISDQIFEHGYYTILSSGNIDGICFFSSIGEYR